MTLSILFRLLFAHIIGDFFFQPDKLCRGKYANGNRKYIYLLFHSAIQAVLAYLFAAVWECWLIPVVIFVFHFFIDLCKTLYGKNNLLSFSIDQVLHLIVIIALWYLLFVSNIPHFFLYRILEDCHLWIVLITYVVVLQPTSIFLSIFIKRWTPAEIPDKSLPKAGKWIGYLERVLILTFIYSGNIEGVGFLLAAKSIFRFGELSKPSEIKTTEYVLIGTFASFAIALLSGFIANYFIRLL